MVPYNFKCDNCGKEYEVYQHMKDDHNHECEDCHVPARRIYHPARFKFKFWYGYDKGLGAYVDKQSDKERIMREKNLIEQ